MSKTVVISSRKHNKIFNSIRKTFLMKIEYFMKDEYTLYISYYHKWYTKIFLSVLGFIPSVFSYGVPETMKDLKDLWFERKLGKHPRDIIHLQHMDNLKKDAILKIMKGTNNDQD